MLVSNSLIQRKSWLKTDRIVKVIRNLSIFKKRNGCLTKISHCRLSKNYKADVQIIEKGALHNTYSLK